jgi:hypothetical protein
MAMSDHDKGQKRPGRQPESTDERNARRRARYASNEVLQANARERARRLYAASRGEEFGAGIDIIAANLARIAEFADLRALSIDGVLIDDHLCVTRQNLAHLIGRHPQVLQRMIGDGRWPPPVAKAQGLRGAVYLLEEAQAFAEIFLAQLHKRLNYSHQHAQTRGALFAAAALARETLKISDRI